MLVLILLALILGLVVFVSRMTTPFTFCRSRKRLEGKTCLVTGGTSGIGLEVAIDLAARGARVIVACPFIEEGNNAVKTIVEESENSNVVFKLLDLGNLDSVRDFAKDILETEVRLDILMNNAGINMAPNATGGGTQIPPVIRVNYFGHFLLTNLLLPILEKSGTPLSPSRIVNTISICYKFGRLDVEKICVTKDNEYGRVVLYANSKLALVLMSREFPKRVKTQNVVMNNADPGEVITRIYFNGFSFLLLLGYVFVRLAGSTPYVGAQNLLHVALDKKAGQRSGEVYRNCTPRKRTSAADNQELAEKLWDKSMLLVNLKK